ncbi:AAA family ATPase [Geminicoccus roseus]|uniref:AAA family ATPase n=1 Tax=Geminicoccus roseus TaxID=404900 RepID=UPI0003F78E00|nr:AAA family ATPase [Geminicoccus roseus]
MSQRRFIVITGGPGSGKSTLIQALSARGFPHAPEVGRRIIQRQMAIDGPALPWRDRALFAETMLALEMENYLAQPAETVWFDRGVPDVIGYLRLEGLPVPPHLHEAARAYRYHRQVLICPPWPKIFRQDQERRQTASIAAATCTAMEGVYRDLGYELIEVPRVDVAERVAFVLDCGVLTS